MSVAVATYSFVPLLRMLPPQLARSRSFRYSLSQLPYAAAVLLCVAVATRSFACLSQPLLLLLLLQLHVAVHPGTSTNTAVRTRPRTYDRTSFASITQPLQPPLPVVLLLLLLHAAAAASRCCVAPDSTTGVARSRSHALPLDLLPRAGHTYVHVVDHPAMQHTHGRANTATYAHTRPHVVLLVQLQPPRLVLLLLLSFCCYSCCCCCCWCCRYCCMHVAATYSVVPRASCMLQPLRVAVATMQLLSFPSRCGS
jgi:hypothetical protein